MSLLSNTLSRFVIAFLSRSKCLFRAAVTICCDFGAQENKICCCLPFFSIYVWCLLRQKKQKKWDYINLKSFFTVKEIIIKTQKQPTELGKIFINHIPDKGLISKLYKQLIQLKKTPNNWFKNGQRTWVDIFLNDTNRCPRGTGNDAQHHY